MHQKKSLEKHMKVCEDKDYCYIEMPKKGESLEYHSGVKSMKTPYIIVADIESLLRKMGHSKSTFVQKSHF